MAFKDILVQIDNSRSNEGRLKAAVELALAHEAHLTGLYRIPEINPQLYADVYAPLEPLDVQRERIEAMTEEAREHFEQVTGAAGVSSDWRALHGTLVSLLAAAGLYADLIVVGQHEPEDRRSVSMGVAEALVLEAGRPVLVIPYVGARPTLGRHVLVAWRETREAARAAHDALPMLTRAEDVHVMTVTESGEDAERAELAADALAAHLARHGIRTTSHHEVNPDVAAGEFLLSRAADLGVDTMVMGAYGHTRLRELVLGGVTRTVLEEMTVPVLFSH